MRLVNIAVALFIVMKLIYYTFADYTNPYWAITYYVPLYFLLISLLLFVRENAYRKSQRAFISVAVVYFMVLLLAHLVCLFHIQWYYTIMVDIGKIGLGAAVLLIGIVLLNYIKSHDK